ncbi:type II secretion system F family protein [Streptomyces sp. NPDC059611]|uniref:type II secretion system F family protein n=1 Tax=Streptomyces sp. NPDC059611 TaxID=3346884 RepID=UPI0036A5BB53
MILSPYAIIGGALAGLGLVIAARGILPGRPDLGDVLSRMDATRLENLERDRETQPNSLMEKAGAFLLRTVGDGTLRLPRQQLELVGRSPAAHLGRKLALALYGLLLPVLGVGLTNLAGFPFPMAIPAIAGIGLAVIFWLIPDLQLKQQATEAKQDFRYAVKAYLRLVQLEREAGAAPTQALKRAAEVGEGWVFSKIRDTITRAELDGISPWEGLKRLSLELDVPELGAPADIIAIAGEDGAAVGDTLGAQAKSLSGALVTSAKAQANMASEKMVMPVAMLVMIMTVYIGYPAIARIMAG